MKKKLTLFIASILLTMSTQAQIFKKLKDKVKESAERAIERKADEEINKTTETTVDSIFEAPKKLKKKKGEKNNKKVTQNDKDDDETNFPGNIFTSEASYDSKYIFPVTATIEIEDINANVEKMTMKQGYGKDALITETVPHGDPVIIDMKNESAIILNISGGTAQIMSLAWMEKMIGNESYSNEELTNEKPTVKKTGKTKTINGYTCHEYDIFFEEGKINAWYAPDVKFDYQDYLRGMAKMFSKKKEGNPMQLLNTNYGYVMEMTFYNKQNETQNSMKVIALEEKVRMITMDNFKIQKL